MAQATSKQDGGPFSLGTAVLAAFDLLLAAPAAGALIALYSPPQGFREQCGSMAAMAAALTSAATGACLLGDLWRRRPRLRSWALRGQLCATCSFGLVIFMAMTESAGGDMAFFTGLGNLLLSAVALFPAVISLAGFLYLLRARSNPPDKSVVQQ